MSIRTTDGSILSPSWKSALDITCILLSLPVWLPLMILLSVVTRIASPGPIFYWQERIGFCGRHFFIWKFRTMKLSSETQVHEHHVEQLMRADCPMTKLDAHGDPRLAPFGRFLRASGLDELPQIFNVLRGEMSLVGPRPCTPSEFAHYEPWQRERVNGLPGLTGYWQVNGKNKTTFNQMIAMDLFYLKNVSILLDLKIMLKTGAVIAGQLLESQQKAQRSRQNGNRCSPVLLLPVSTAAAQVQSWLLEKASSLWYLVQYLRARVEHAAVGFVALVLALCQQGKVTQQAGRLAEQAGELTERAFATSLVVTSFVAPALAETTNFNLNMQNASPPPSAGPDSRKSKVASRIFERGPRRAQPQYQASPALRVERTIEHQWRRLGAARKSVHSAFARLIREVHPQQSKQKHRKQQRS